MKYLLSRFSLFWPEIIDIDGIRIPLRGSPLSRQMRRRLMRGLYETAEREMVKTFIQPGERILELGASIGILTCLLAKFAGATGRVVSVEPDASLKPHFERQLGLNGVRGELLQALCCPIWTQPVPETLLTRSFLPSRNTLSGRVTESGWTETKVQWVTAGEICSKNDLEPTAMVADIEGTEGVWAEYSPNFPESLRTIIIELHTHIVGTRCAGQVVQAVLGEGFRVAGVQRNVFVFERV